MTMTPDAGIVLYTAVSVGGDFYAPNIYNMTRVDHIASMKQATISSSTSLNALNVNALGTVTASYINSIGTVAALNMNTGAINASSLSISSSGSSRGSITTPSLTVSGLLTEKGGIVASAASLTWAATTINLTSMTNTPIISFNSTGITLAADVAMNYNSISGLTNLTASGTITSDTAITNTLTTSGVALTLKAILFCSEDSTAQYTWMLILEECFSIAMCI